MLSATHRDEKEIASDEAVCILIVTRRDHTGAVDQEQGKVLRSLADENGYLLPGGKQDFPPAKDQRALLQFLNCTRRSSAGRYEARP